METITLQYNPKSNFATALANLIEKSEGVKVIETKPTKSARKRLTEKERVLADIATGAEQARRIAKRKHKTYTADELIASLWLHLHPRRSSTKT